MTAAVLDPLIDGMTIRRVLPLHESSRRLRDLSPDSPRVHGVAVMADVSRRRWWPLDSVTSGRLAAMFESAADELGDRRAAAQQLAGHVAHGSAPGGHLVRPRGPILGCRAGESLDAYRFGGVDRLGRRRGPDASGAARRSRDHRRGPAAQRACAGHLDRAPLSSLAGAHIRRTPPPRPGVRSRRRPCGRWSGRQWSSPPPRCRCSPAPAKSPACGVARRCSTR